MRYTILLTMIFAGSRAFSQHCHAATDTLKYISSSGYYTTVKYTNRFATVPISYKIAGSNKVYSGFKYVYIFNGFFTDREETMGVFYDKEKRRVMAVKSYCFR